MSKIQFYNLPLPCYEIGWCNVTSVRQMRCAAQIVNETRN